MWRAWWTWLGWGPAGSGASAGTVRPRNPRYPPGDAATALWRFALGGCTISVLLQFMCRQLQPARDDLSSGLPGGTCQSLYSRQWTWLN